MRNRSLRVSGCHLRSLSYSGVTFKNCLYFRTISESFFGAWVSPKPKMAVAIFGCVVGNMVFLRGLCALKHDIAHRKSDYDYYLEAIIILNFDAEFEVRDDKFVTTTFILRVLTFGLKEISAISPRAVGKVLAIDPSLRSK